MDHRTLRKINHLAESLKRNRLASDMDEAVKMAKGMLLKDDDTPIAELKQLAKQLHEEGERLDALVGETEALKIDAQIANERHAEEAALADEHSKAFDETKKEIQATKQEVEALREAKGDAPAVLKKEQEASASEDFAKKDLPGEKGESDTEKQE